LLELNKPNQIYHGKGKKIELVHKGEMAEKGKEKE